MKKIFFSLLLSVPFVASAATDTAGKKLYPVPETQRPAISSPADLTLPPRTLRKGSDALAKVAPVGKLIEGYQSSYSYGLLPGIYRFNTDADTELLYIDDYTRQGYELTQGWMRDGRLCATAEYYLFSLMELRYLEMDPFTGEIFTDKEIDFIDPVTQFSNYLPYFYSSAYNPTTDRVYGYGSSENGKGYAFFSAPGNDPSKAICVATPQYEEVCVSVAYNPNDGFIYGVNRNDDFVKISPETGEQTVIMPTGLSTRYAMAGMMYMEETGKFLLNTLLTDNTCGLAEIDPVAKTITQICQFDNFEQFPFMYMVDASNDPCPIKCPDIDEAKFSHGSHSGYISYFVPSEYFLGGNLSGELHWYAALDGKPYAEGSATPGDVQIVEYSDLSVGEHVFDFYVAQDSQKSTVCSFAMYIGYDTPLPTASVTLSETKIEWSPVTRCVNNGYLDPKTLKYHVYVNDQEVGVTSDTHLDYSLPVNAPYDSYTAKVVVDNMGNLSSPTLSDNIRCGAPWTPDFHITPTAHQAKLFSAFDINQDKSSWAFYEDDENPEVGQFYGPYSTSSKSNDWLFTPPIQLDDVDASYEFSYDLGNFSSWYPDIQVGVYLTNDLNPNKVVTTLQEKGAIANTKEFTNYAQRFTISEPGVYYIGFFCDAEMYQRGIRLQNIALKKLSSSTSLPAEVTNLTVEGAPLGELKAILTFNLPEKYISGESIPESVEVTAKVTLGDNVVAKSGAPGEKINIAIPSTQGFNQVSIKTYINNEEGNALIANVFTGVDVPGPVSSLDGYVSEDNLSLIMKWTAPAGGENGYYIDPSDVVYNLMVYGEEGWEVAEVLGKNVFEYTYSVPQGSSLATTFVGIAPSTVAGVSSSTGWLSDALGTPYDLPVKEEFEGASFKYGPIRIIRLNENYNSAEWGVVNPRLINPSMEVASEVACYGRSEEPDQRGMLMLPKFNLENVASPGIVFECWTGNNTADVTIYGETFDSNGFVPIGKFPTDGDGWQTVELPFPAQFAGHKWVAIYIDAYFKTADSYALFSNYEVRGGVSGVAIVPVDGGCIYPAEGAIVAEGLSGKELYIFSLDGKTIWSGKCNSSIEKIAVSPGTYVARASSTSIKVIVK